MDSITTLSKRVPLGGLDANKRNTPTSAAKQTDVGKSDAEIAVLGKRIADELADGEIDTRQGTPIKKRKDADAVHVLGNMIGEENEVSIVGVNDYKFEEVEKSINEANDYKSGGVEKESETRSMENDSLLSYSITRNSSPVSSLEGSQQTTTLENSQETAITEQDQDDNTESRTRLATAQQQAHALRLRLKMAMYKVHTNQTSVPLSRLEIRFSSFSHSTSSRGNQRSKLNISSYPALRENSEGEALLVGARSALSSFQEVSMSQASHMHSNFRFKPEAPQIAGHRVGIGSSSHAHPELVPYARQKRRTASLSSEMEASDVELDIPQPRIIPGRTRAQGYPREKIFRSFDAGCMNRALADRNGGDNASVRGELNITGMGRDTDDKPILANENDSQDRNGNPRTDELDVAAGGLLELMSQGRSEAR